MQSFVTLSHIIGQKPRYKVQSPSNTFLRLSSLLNLGLCVQHAHLCYKGCRSWLELWKHPDSIILHAFLWTFDAFSVQMDSFFYKPHFEWWVRMNPEAQRKHQPRPLSLTCFRVSSINQPRFTQTKFITPWETLKAEFPGEVHRVFWFHGQYLITWDSAWKIVILLMREII